MLRVAAIFPFAKQTPTGETHKQTRTKYNQTVKFRRQCQTFLYEPYEPYDICDMRGRFQFSVVGVVGVVQNRIITEDIKFLQENMIYLVFCKAVHFWR